MPRVCMPAAVEGKQGGAREPMRKPPQWWFAERAPQWSTQKGPGHVRHAEEYKAYRVSG
jgi:hypothetical protein